MTTVIPSQFWPPKSFGPKAARRNEARRRMSQRSQPPPPRQAKVFPAPRRAMVSKDLLPAVEQKSLDSGVTNAVAMLTGSIACPAEVPAQRLPLDTPVASSLMNVHALWSGGTSTLTGTPYTAAFILYKQLARQTVATLAFPTATALDTRYNLLGEREQSAGGVPQMVLDGYLETSVIIGTPVSYAQTIRYRKNWPVVGAVPNFSSLDVTVHHGPFLPVGIDNAKDRWILCSENSTINLQFDPTAYSTAGGTLSQVLDTNQYYYYFSAILYFFDGPGEPKREIKRAKHASNSLLATTLTFDIAQAGYYTLDIGDITFGTTSPISTSTPIENLIYIYLQNDPTKLFWSNYMAPEIYEDSQVCAKHRVIASSFLLTNTTAILNKEGVITAATLNPEVNPFRLSTTELGTKVGATSHGLAKGMYVFQKPERQQLQFRRGSLATFVDATASSAPPAQERPFFYMDDMMSYDMITLDDLDTSTTSTWRLRRDTHWEFRSSSQRYVRALPLLDEECFDSVMRILATLPNHVDNPIHWANIGRAIKRAAEWTFRNRGKILNVGHLLSDTFLPGASRQVANAALDKTGQFADKMEQILQ